MTYFDAMDRYGTDKPDLRFGVELVDCTEYFKDTPFRVFQVPYVGAVVMPGGASQPRRTLDGWQDFARQRGHRGLAYVLVGDDGELSGPVAKNLSADERAGLAGRSARSPATACSSPPVAVTPPARCSAPPCLRSAGARADRRVAVVVPVGRRRAAVRAQFGCRGGRRRRGRLRGVTAVHHAFTSPKPEFLDTFDTDPGPALAYAYDIVCNGNEIGGGSIRIHRRDVQERVFKVMGLSQTEAQTKFGFLLDAFKFGAPPHGGIAFGWDRICALLSNTSRSATSSPSPRPAAATTR